MARPDPALTLVTCGGTVSMVAAVDPVPAPHLAGARSLVPGPVDPVRALVADRWPGPVHHVHAGDLASEDSSPRWFGHLAALVRDAATRGPVLVTHGTDTLCWSAAALAAVGPWPHPVVLTGSNLPLCDPDSDAPTSLAAALHVAASATPAVSVVFAGTRGATANVVQGGFARKLHASGACVADVAGTPWAKVRPGGPLEVLSPLRDHPTTPTGRFARHVTVVRTWPGWDPSTVSLPATSTVVVELYPCATAPPVLVAAVARWTRAGHRVVACPPAPVTTCPYPSTAALERAGATVATKLTVELAATLAMAAGPLPTDGHRGPSPYRRPPARPDSPGGDMEPAAAPTASVDTARLAADNAALRRQLDEATTELVGLREAVGDHRATRMGAGDDADRLLWDAAGVG